MVQLPLVQASQDSRIIVTIPHTQTVSDYT